MHRIDIYLKSGNIVSLDCESFEVHKSQLDGELMTLKWKTAPGAVNRLMYVRLDDVAAVVEAR